MGGLSQALGIALVDGVTDARQGAGRVVPKNLDQLA
jgi:hypothetical protein